MGTHADTLAEALPLTASHNMTKHTHTLTVSVEELSEVDGDDHPVPWPVPEAPEADVHGACPGLRVHAAEVQGVAGEVVHTPALALVCGKPARVKRRPGRGSER